MTGSIKSPEFEAEAKSEVWTLTCRLNDTVEQSQELYHIARQNILDENPHGLVIVVGTNDLPRRMLNSRRRQLNDQEVANNILATGQLAHSMGVKNVFIFSIICRRGVYFEKRRREINKILEEGCLMYGFIFINNDNIRLQAHRWPSSK